METREQVIESKPKRIPNPTGKGGFQERPQDRSRGTWDSKNTISYQYGRFINMTPKELQAFAKAPDNEKTVAMVLAYNRVIAANKSLPDLKEITDRIEGRAVQKMEVKAEVNTIDSILD